LQGGAQNDILNGGGADTASYADATTPVTASLATDFATCAAVGSDLLSYVERLTGTAGADTLTVADSNGSSNAANILEGLVGADTLDAQEGTGNDKVDGGAGMDTCQKDPEDKVVSCP
jgi:Ca2+-binding RTX toxin-like protein